MKRWAKAPWSEIQKIYTGQLSEGQALVRRIAERQAQQDYFYGMLGGAVALTVLIGFVSLVFGSPIADIVKMSTDTNAQPWVVPLVWLCPLLGGIGAIVSVMQRMSTGDCGLRYRAGRGALTILGAVRPIIGAVLGTAIAAVIGAHLVPMHTDGAVPLVFFGVVAFLAGFSERWAQDMLGTSRSQLTPNNEADSRLAAA
jgi:hypothetical protein